jgi:hypothetical protein
MAELFFKYKTIPYLFDTGRLKLFRLKDNKRIEINNPEILREVRLSSIEINRERAISLAHERAK